VKKANVAVTQVLVQWTGLPDTVATWEDYEVMRHLFACTSLGTDCFFGGGVLSPPPSWWLRLMV
jgi:hypothetical protein